MMVNHAVEEVADQLRVPEPLLVTVTVWLDGFVPPWIAENDMDAGLRPMTGVEGVEEVIVVEEVDVGSSNWVRPGMAVDSLFIPRPPLEFPEFPPLLDEPGAATAETGAEPDERDVVGLETAPANDRDVAGAVVVVDVGFGVTAVDAIELWAVESVLRV